MNQILTSQTAEGGRRILLNNIKYMCIFFMLFGLIILGEGGWNLYCNLSMEADVEKPIVIGQQNGLKTSFQVNSGIGVQKIIYSWNNGEETVIEKEGQKALSFDVDNRIGENDLILKIVDMDGNTITYNNIKIVYEQEQTQNTTTPEPTTETTPQTEEEWKKAIENDKTEPMITLSSEKGKVVINAIDDVKMSYVTYKWNDGDEKKITGLSDDEKTLNAKIDALKGDNKLTVKAYDFAGNVKEMTKDVHGTDGPKIAVTKEDGKIKAVVTNEYNLTKIEYNFNGEETVVENINNTSYEFTLDLVDGENYIIIYAYEGAVKAEYKGKTTK